MIERPLTDEEFQRMKSAATAMLGEKIVACVEASAFRLFDEPEGTVRASIALAWAMLMNRHLDRTELQ